MQHDFGCIDRRIGTIISRTISYNVSGLKNAWKVLLLSILIAAGFGLVNGLGNYFITLGTKPGALGSSVTFPIVNGGTIVFSSLIGLIAFKEKITWKTWIGLALVVLSTTLFMFAQ